MNETTQTQINLGDYNKPQEQTKALGIGKISGRIINIRDFRINRGKPSHYTPQESIGEDGMTDYNIIDTVESFDVKDQQADPGEQPVHQADDQLAADHAVETVGQPLQTQAKVGLGDGGGRRGRYAHGWTTHRVRSARPPDATPLHSMVAAGESCRN